MPYTKPERREVVDSFKGEYGDLVYFYYKILVEAWTFNPSFSRYFQMRYLVPNYQEKVDGDILSAVAEVDESGESILRVPECLQSIEFAKYHAYDCAVDELKRRYVDPYENQKLKENGDINV